MTDDKAVAWLEFAELHPALWKYYEGWCQCITCCEYRKKFADWYDEAAKGGRDE
jgi:hypothetical protein